MTTKQNLAELEVQRLEHVGNAIKEAIIAAGYNADLPFGELARAAISAAERFPAEGWPFGRNLNSLPEEIHPSVVRAFSEIDAAIYSGEMLALPDQHLFLAAHAQRWSRSATQNRVEFIKELEESPQP